MREVLRPFGKYFLLDQLSAGGMADILRALGPEENGRRQVVVLKRIQQPHADREEFHKMFWSEIALTMRFRHPNIVRLHNFGEEEEQPYLAMEYIQGLSLRSLVSRFHEKKHGFPIEFSLWTIAEAAAGLGYAHAFRDSLTGQAINIVHRDISPHNILVSFAGEVKIIDFGISKASVLEEITKEGMLKGKPCYMAPEYVHGGKIDHRFDLFALGVVLWEMLCGKRLFLAENDFATLKMVRDCESVIVPPSSINPKLPKALDAVVLRALAKNPADRFQNAEDLRDALLGVLHSVSPRFEASQFRASLREVFADQIEKETRQLDALLERAAVARMNALSGKPYAVQTTWDESSYGDSGRGNSLPTAPSLLMPPRPSTTKTIPTPQMPLPRHPHQIEARTPWGWILLSTALATSLAFTTQEKWQPLVARWIPPSVLNLRDHPRLPASAPASTPAVPAASDSAPAPAVPSTVPKSAAPERIVPAKKRPTIAGQKKNRKPKRAQQKKTASTRNGATARKPAGKPKLESREEGRKPFRTDSKGKKLIPASDF